MWATRPGEDLGLGSGRDVVPGLCMDEWREENRGLEMDTSLNRDDEQRVDKDSPEVENQKQTKLWET